MHTHSAPPLPPHLAPPVFPFHPPSHPSTRHLSLQPAPQGPQPSTTCVTPLAAKNSLPVPRSLLWETLLDPPTCNSQSAPPRPRHTPPTHHRVPVLTPAAIPTCRQLLSSRKARTTHNTLTLHGVLSGSKRCRFNNAGDVIPPSRFPFVNPKRPRQAGGPSKRLNFHNFQAWKLMQSRSIVAGRVGASGAGIFFCSFCCGFPRGLVVRLRDCLCSHTREPQKVMSDYSRSTRVGYRYEGEDLVSSPDGSAVMRIITLA